MNSTVKNLRIVGLSILFDGLINYINKYKYIEIDYNLFEFINELSCSLKVTFIVFKYRIIKY